MYNRSRLLSPAPDDLNILCSWPPAGSKTAVVKGGSGAQRCAGDHWCVSWAITGPEDFLLIFSCSGWIFGKGFRFGGACAQIADIDFRIPSSFWPLLADMFFQCSRVPWTSDAPSQIQFWDRCARFSFLPRSWRAWKKCCVSLSASLCQHSSERWPYWLFIRPTQPPSWADANYVGSRGYSS